MYDFIYFYNQNETILNLISLINKFNFPFFIILNENVNYNSSNESFSIENLTILNKSLTNVLYTIKIYSKSENYINYKGTYILGFYYHSNIYNDKRLGILKKKEIVKLRKKIKDVNEKYKADKKDLDNIKAKDYKLMSVGRAMSLFRKKRI